MKSCTTGAAGEYYVAYKLASMGLIVALPRSGSMGIDILVSDVEGKRTYSIQVKSTDWALRLRGRGANKVPFQLQFPLGYKSAKSSSENLYFAFVDMKGVMNSDEPDVYVVPSQFIFDYCKDWVENVKMVRLHIPIELMEKYKNNWDCFL